MKTIILCSLLSLIIATSGYTMNKSPRTHHNKDTEQLHAAPMATVTEPPPQTAAAASDAQPSLYELAAPLLTLSSFIYDFIDLRKQAKDDILKISTDLDFDRLHAIKTIVAYKSEQIDASQGIEALMKDPTKQDMLNLTTNFKLLELPKTAAEISNDLENYRKRDETKEEKEFLEEAYPNSYLDYVADEHLLPEYDCELSYAIAVCDRLQSIVVIFRGTKNFFDWRQNIQIKKTDLTLPGHGYINEDGAADGMAVEPQTFGGVHKGFYDYLFGETAIAGISKGEAIMKRLKELLKEKPGYSLKFTGHSLGGAMSTLMAFRAAAFGEFGDTTIINVSFASPYFGDASVRNKFAELEKQKKLQHLRVSNHGDIVPLAPFIGMKHMGVHLELYKQEGSRPRIAYPKPGGFFNEMKNAINANVLQGVGTKTIDYHSCAEYTARLQTAKDELDQVSLDDKYSDQKFTGLS